MLINNGHMISLMTVMMVLVDVDVRLLPDLVVVLVVVLVVDKMKVVKSRLKTCTIMLLKKIYR